MNRNGITLNRFWTCIVLILTTVFSVAAQGKGIAGELMPAINLVNISTNKKSLALGRSLQYREGKGLWGADRRTLQSHR